MAARRNPKKRPSARRHLPVVYADGAQRYLTTGCSLLDCVLGGGWAEDRMINIVGDSSTGKTLMAIEACANFARKHSNGLIRYGEFEEAFDPLYAQAVGLPLDRVAFQDFDDQPPITTVEEWFDSLELMIERCTKANAPGLYIVDSIDALSSKAEQERDIGDGSYGTERAKKVGETMRRAYGKLSRANITLIVISQTRAKIGVTFGEKKTRSGGAALDFYSSQILWLSEVKKTKKTVRGIDRVTGIQIRARCRKNKAGVAHRDCDMPLVFGYGIDDMLANAEFLKSTVGFQHESIEGLKLGATTYKTKLQKLRNVGGSEYLSVRAQLSEAVEDVWLGIEKEFTPERGKYE